MQSSEPANNHDNTNRTIIFIVSALTIFFIFLTLFLSSFKIDIITVDCTGFWAQGACQSGYASQREQITEFNPLNILNLIVIPLMIACFVITVTYMAKHNKRFRNILTITWISTVVISIIFISIIGINMASKPTVLPGGVTIEERDCVNKINISLRQGTATPDCKSPTFNSLGN